MNGWNASEFAFEIRVCRWAELAWPPSGERSSAHIVARQLGTRSRRWDTIVVECDPEGLTERGAFGDSALDAELLDIVRHAPETWTWYRDVLPEPDYPWRYVREAVHRAADRGVVKCRKRANRIEIKQVAPYPDWVKRIVAIENKPDLDASAADALAAQLEHDVRADLADEVWVGTARTTRRVEPALLERLPVEAGIVTLSFDEGVHADAGTVLWHPSDLRAGVTSTTSTGSTPTRTDRRLVLAERAYGRGWRSYHRTMRPDCRHFELDRDGRALIPWCGAKRRVQTARECAGSCGAFEPEPPAWRSRGYPIEGGPGRSIVRLLERRKRQVRERHCYDT
ncbi:MAG: DUF5787 family protein [Halobacteriota archaeon]